MNPHLRKKRKKRVFQVLEQSGLMENHGKFQRKQGRQTCNNRKKKNYLVSATNYHSTNFSTENCLAIKIKKTQIFINKTAYLGLTILELSKIVMHVFWQDQVKPEYAEKRKICYIDTESFIAHTEMGEIYNHIAKNFFETRFDTANYELDTLIPKGKKTKKVVELKKD